MTLLALNVMNDGGISPFMIFLCDNGEILINKTSVIMIMDFGFKVHALSGFLGGWVFIRTPSSVH